MWAVRREFIDEYMASLESPTSPRNTQRRLVDLQNIMPRPTRTGRMSADYLVPPPVRPVNLMPRTSSTPVTPNMDAYAQYLSRTSGR